MKANVIARFEGGFYSTQVEFGNWIPMGINQIATRPDELPLRFEEIVAGTVEGRLIQQFPAGNVSRFLWGPA